MNIKEYMTSGTLELYVMGALEPDEKAELEHMMELHPELRKEMELIEQSMNALTMATAVEPRAELREKILAEVLNADKEADVVTLYRESGIYRWVAVAAILVLVVSNVFFSYKWRLAETRLASIVDQNLKLAQGYELIKATYQQSSNNLAIATNPKYKHVELAGQAAAPEGNVSVFWQPQDHSTYVMVHKLPVNVSEKQYQLWALVDGQPVDAGVFDVNGDGVMLKLKNVENAQAFAVTLEPKGGSVIPTLSQLMVMGKI